MNFFNEVFWSGIKILKNEYWWLENILTLFVFSILAGLFANMTRRFCEHKSREQYQGWTLKIIPKKSGETRNTYNSKLLWDEVRKFEESEFEANKFIKSICSSENIRVDSGEIITNDPNGWVYKNKEQRTYTFDFNKFPN